MYTRHTTLATCYQLAQPIFKIGFALAKKGGIGGGGWVSAQGAVHMVAALQLFFNFFIFFLFIIILV